MENEIVYRQGEVKDSYRIAQLIDESSPGVINYLYADLLTDITPLQFCAQLLCIDPVYNVQNAIVADKGGRVIGVAMSFPSSQHVLDEGLKEKLSEEKVRFLSRYFPQRDREIYLLDAICVSEPFRKNGIGGHLLSHTIEKMKKCGFSRLGITVLRENSDLVGWYERKGFRTESIKEFMGPSQDARVNTVRYMENVLK